MKYAILYVFLCLLLTMCNTHRNNAKSNQPYVCGGAFPFKSVSDREQLHKKLKLSDTSKTFVFVKLITEDDKGESNSAYTNVRFINREGDTINKMSDVTGEVNMLVSSGRQLLIIDYPPIYKVDTIINLSSNSVINLLVKINILKKDIYYLDAKPKEYSMLDAINNEK